MPVKAQHISADKPAKIGAPHEAAEANADRVADCLTAPPTVQPLACSACAAGDAPCPACATGAATLRRKTLTGAAAGSDMTRAVGQALAAPAAALPDATRRRFELRLGTDLGALRLHTGAAAARGARSVGARAFALGQDIVFGAGEFRPDTQEGQHLLAHEVAHVMQGGTGDTLRRAPKTPPDPAEDAAVDFRMQRLDASVEALGETGQFLHRGHRHAGIRQLRRCRTGGDDRDAVVSQLLSQLDQPRLVVNRDQGPTNRLQLSHASPSPVRKLRGRAVRAQPP